MKYNKKMLLNTFITLFVLTCLLAVPGVAISQEDFTAILVVHGSNDPVWNNQVVTFYNNLAGQEPRLKRLAFLYFGGNERNLENVVIDLRDNLNVRNFLFVHLSPSSHSIRHREIRDSVSPLIQPPRQYSISPAMNDHHLAKTILQQRAGQFSDDHRTESLILVGYGPIDENDNNRWENQLRHIGQTIKQELNFRDLDCINLRYHAEDAKRAKAVKKLRREIVKPLTQRGDVIVVPYVLCDGSVSRDSFHKDLHDYLWGVEHNTSGEVMIANQGVISHDNTRQWVLERIDAGMTQPEITSANPWSAMEALKKAQ